MKTARALLAVLCTFCVTRSLIAAADLAGAAAIPPPSPRGAAPPSSSPDPKRAELRKKLETTLTLLASDLQGACGYVIRDLESGETFERDGDAVFPAASTIKLPIFIELYKRAEEGGIDLERPVTIDPTARVEGGGVLEKWTAPYPVLSARQLSVLMMDFSDNYATNLLTDLVGMDDVGRRLRDWGFKDTLLRRKMMDLEAARAGRENVTTAREMAALLERLHRGGLLNPDHTQAVIDVMKRNEGTPIKRGLPPGVEAADKDGELDGLRCDSGIVFVEAVPAPAGAGGAARPLVISVMTAYLEDDAAGETFISAVTRAAYRYVRMSQNSTGYGRRMAGSLRGRLDQRVARGTVPDCR